jgi:hypothetical protein
MTLLFSGVRDYEVPVFREVTTGVMQVVVPVKERVGDIPGVFPAPQLKIQLQRLRIAERDAITLFQRLQAPIGEVFISPSHRTICKDGVDVVHFFVEVAAQLDQSEVGEEVPSGVRLKDHVPVSVDHDRVVAPDRFTKPADVVVVTVVQDVSEAFLGTRLDVVQSPTEARFRLHVQIRPPEAVVPHPEMGGDPLRERETHRIPSFLIFPGKTLDLGARLR